MCVEESKLVLRLTSAMCVLLLQDGGERKESVVLSTQTGDLLKHPAFVTGQGRERKCPVLDSIPRSSLRVTD